MEPRNATDGQPLFEAMCGTYDHYLRVPRGGGYRILSNGTEVGSWEAWPRAACMRTYMDLAGHARAPRAACPAKCGAGQHVRATRGTAGATARIDQRRGAESRAVAGR